MQTKFIFVADTTGDINQVDGKANEALRRFLAGLTACPVSAVRIVAGQTSPRKIVEIEGIDSQALDRAILESQART